MHEMYSILQTVELCMCIFYAIIIILSWKTKERIMEFLLIVLGGFLLFVNVLQIPIDIELSKSTWPEYLLIGAWLTYNIIRAYRLGQKS